jgi:hypothetical protein
VKTWADVAAIVPTGLSIDRDAGEGPPRCCSRRFVAADALVYFGELATDSRSRVLARFAHLTNVPETELYLCDACRATVRREAVLSREEEPNAKRVLDVDP